MAARGYRIEHTTSIGALSRVQHGALSRAQLSEHGVDPGTVAHQIAARRWQAVGPLVVIVFTGPPPPPTRRWAALLNTGADSALCGRTALEVHGLTGWEEPAVHVIIRRGGRPPTLPSVRLHESRRHTTTDVVVRDDMSCHTVERAAVDVGAWSRSTRSAMGVLAAVVQQRLTTPNRLLTTLQEQGGIRHRRLMLATLEDLRAGSGSVSEIDFVRLCGRWGLPRPRQQSVRRDSQGRRRYLDMTFVLADGSQRAVEIDGIGHMDPLVWYDDLLRAADVTANDKTPVLRLPAAAARVDERRVAEIIGRFLNTKPSCQNLVELSEPRRAIERRGSDSSGRGPGLSPP